MRGRMQYQIKNGLCSYTFWVPELPSCNPSSLEASNNTQNNQPLLVQMRLLFDHQMEKMENALRNNMQRMEKVWQGWGGGAVQGCHCQQV